MASSKSQHQFDDYFIFSDQGGHSNKHPRWCGELRIKLEMNEAMYCSPDPVANWNSLTRFTPSTKGPVEDMPWSSSIRPVMSQRLREVFEKYAPGHVRFYPVRVLYANRPLDVGPYWAAQYMHHIDCRDAIASKKAPSGLVVLRRKIPKDVLLFRVVDYPVVALIHKSLRKILSDEGITGPQYYDSFVLI